MVSLFKTFCVGSHLSEMMAEARHVLEAPLGRRMIEVLVWYFTLRLNSFAFLLIYEQGIL